MKKPKLVFVSPRFLFPADSGGRIRTTQILRGLKGGAFHTVLASPAASVQAQTFAAPLAELADETRFWRETKGPFDRVLRLRHVAGRLPISVASDVSAAGRRVVEEILSGGPAVAVFDFIHAAVLVPRATDVPMVMFTHNVEAEIFARHVKVASGPLLRALWKRQHRKMV